MLTYDQLYHPPDVEEASQTWKANCGPGALAAVLQRPVMSLRARLPGFERRGFCNPSHLLRVLDSLDVRIITHNAAQIAHAIETSVQPEQEPSLYGLLFLQWTGPWCNPGVPVAAQYRYTHWVGTASTQDHGQMYYDINAWREDDQRGAWVPTSWWEHEILPAITCTIKRADGGYYVRTALEVPHAPLP